MKLKVIIKILIIALALDCGIVLALLLSDRIAQPFIILYWALLMVKNACDYFNNGGKK